MGMLDTQTNDGYLYSRPFIHDGCHHMVVACPKGDGFSIVVIDICETGDVRVTPLLPDESPCNESLAHRRIEAFNEINARNGVPSSNERLTRERARAVLPTLVS